MELININEFSQNMATLIKKVNNDHTPIMIIHQKEKPGVLISLEDFNSYEETAYLMQSPKNAARINSAVEQLEAGQGFERDLVECS